jgi:hypothetical protein
LIKHSVAQFFKLWFSNEHLYVVLKRTISTSVHKITSMNIPEILIKTADGCRIDLQSGRINGAEVEILRFTNSDRASKNESSTMI